MTTEEYYIHEIKRNLSLARNHANRGDHYSARMMIEDAREIAKESGLTKALNLVDDNKGSILKQADLNTAKKQ